MFNRLGLTVTVSVLQFNEFCSDFLKFSLISDKTFKNGSSKIFQRLFSSTNFTWSSLEYLDSFVSFTKKASRLVQFVCLAALSKVRELLKNEI